MHSNGIKIALQKRDQSISLLRRIQTTINEDLTLEYKRYQKQRRGTSDNAKRVNAYCNDNYGDLAYTWPDA